MKQKYVRNVATLTLSAEKCTGCGLCMIVCPHGVFEIDAKGTFIADKDSCMECGVCAINCPNEAIEVCAGVGFATAMILGEGCCNA